MQPPPPARCHLHNNNITYYLNHACCRPWINFKSVLLATYLPTREFKRWLSPIRYARRESVCAGLQLHVFVSSDGVDMGAPCTLSNHGCMRSLSQHHRGCVSLALLHSNLSSHVCMVRACVLLQITSLDEWLDIFDSPMTLSLSAEQCYPLPARPVY